MLTSVLLLTPHHHHPHRRASDRVTPFACPPHRCAATSTRTCAAPCTSSCRRSRCRRTTRTSATTLATSSPTPASSPTVSLVRYIAPRASRQNFGRRKIQRDHCARTKSALVVVGLLRRSCSFRFFASLKLSRLMARDERVDVLSSFSGPAAPYLRHLLEGEGKAHTAGGVALIRRSVMSRVGRRGDRSWRRSSPQASLLSCTRRV